LVSADIIGRSHKLVLSNTSNIRAIRDPIITVSIIVRSQNVPTFLFIQASIFLIAFGFGLLVLWEIFETLVLFWFSVKLRREEAAEGEIPPCGRGFSRHEDLSSDLLWAA
jgi:hypothetical protein